MCHTVVDDRRIHARIEAQLHCTIASEEDQQPLPGVIRDLSHGGAMVRARNFIASLGDDVTINMELPDQETVIVSAEVIRIEELGSESDYALRFERVEPDRRTALNGLINSMVDEEHQIFHPPRRVSITCDSDEAFDEITKKAYAGSLKVVCALPLVIEEAVSVDISVRDQRKLVVLPGIVTEVRHKGDASNFVDIRFEAD